MAQRHELVIKLCSQDNRIVRLLMVQSHLVSMTNATATDLIH
jgi:hypothetical protein